MFYYNIDELTEDGILTLIKDHKKNHLPRYINLQKYYETKHSILDRDTTDANKPNNKIANGFPKYIVDVLRGYFTGEPVRYTSKNEDLMKILQEIFDYNDEQNENSRIAKIMGIKGRCYEILYIDEDSQIRFKYVSPDNMFVVYDNSIEGNMIAAVRYYTVKKLGTGTSTTKVEVYLKDWIMYYEEDQGRLNFISQKENFFGDVPVTEFINNDECLGDFETVISLVDAYDKAQSDSLNELEYFADAYLVLQGMPETEEEDIKEMKKNRVMVLPSPMQGEKAGAYWLVKDINDTLVENLKKRLQSDIHKYSMTPDLNDESFGGNLSGVAIEYKLWGLEQAAVTKESNFKLGLQRRIELICNMLAIKGKGTYNYLDIEMSFTRNMPTNIPEIVTMVQNLNGVISNQTRVSLLPFVEDPQTEIDKLEAEQNEIDLDSVDYEDEGSNRNLQVSKILSLISRLPEKDRDAAKDILEDMRRKSNA